MKNTAVLLLDCPDRKGLVAAISTFLYMHGANILDADQHQDNELMLFFMRVEFSLDDFDLNAQSFQEHFQPIAERFEIKWSLKYSTARPSVAIFVSRQIHCLADLLYRHHAGEFPCRIALVVSNHDAAAPLAAFYGIPFQHLPVSPGSNEQVERHQLALLERDSIELVVLARYMQVLSSDFVARYPWQIINVHHSFLPAFTGGRPYHGAFERGVKLIGATSHYVTDVLDDGPIIDQDVIRISHRDQLPDLIQKGRDAEKVVLARAVRWHLEHRILVHGNKTVVFD
jgi:formyltetrahydrofolate deformylase